MKKISSTFSRVLPFIALLVVALGCGQGDNNETSIVATNSSTTAASTTPSGSTPEIVGTYDISGTNENGAGAYKGTLDVKSRGDVYQFSWNTAGKIYDGVGVRTGNNVGVAFAEGENGEGCGVVLYRIGGDGTLDGKAGYWGNNSSETETATRTAGNGLDGNYTISGKNTDGKEYQGTLAVNRSGAGYAFTWQAPSTLKGFGIQQGAAVAVGIGGNKCGFVSYEVKSDGTLDGKWGGYGSTSVGTEIAKKK